MFFVAASVGSHAGMRVDRRGCQISAWKAEWSDMGFPFCRPAVASAGWYHMAHIGIQKINFSQECRGGDSYVV